MYRLANMISGILAVTLVLGLVLAFLFAGSAPKSDSTVNAAENGRPMLHDGVMAMPPAETPAP